MIKFEYFSLNHLSIEGTIYKEGNFRFDEQSHFNFLFSYERFVVHKLIKYKIPLYILRDEQERVIAGLFNEFEVSSV